MLKAGQMEEAATILGLAERILGCWDIGELAKNCRLQKLNVLESCSASVASGCAGRFGMF